MMVAVEMYLKRDHAAEWRDWEKRVKTIAPSVGPIKSVKTETFIPEIANAVPHLRIVWNESALKITSQEVTKKLLEGEPSIELLLCAEGGHNRRRRGGRRSRNSKRRSWRGGSGKLFSAG